MAPEKKSARRSGKSAGNVDKISCIKLTVVSPEELKSDESLGRGRKSDCQFDTGVSNF